MGRGEVRVSRDLTDKAESARVWRLAGRVSQSRRRARRSQRLIAIASAGVLAATAAASSEEGRTFVDGLRVLWPLAGVPLFFGITSIDRVWARTAARRTRTVFRDHPHVEVRVGEAGIESEQGDVATRLRWSIVNGVAECEDLLVFVADLPRHLMVMAVPLDRLTSAQAAAVRAMAREAPGERQWLTVRPQQGSSRLRVVGDEPADGALESVSVALDPGRAPPPD